MKVKFFEFKRRGFIEVLILALLLALAVISFVFFHSWFLSFASEEVKKAEKNNDNLKFEHYEGGILYLRNFGSDTVNINLLKVGDKNCNLNSTYSGDIIWVNLSECISGLNLDFEVISIVTDSQILIENVNFAENSS